MLVLHLGIVESIPRFYPREVRRVLNTLPRNWILRVLNGVELPIAKLIKKRSGWIAPRDFAKYLIEVINESRERFGVKRIVLINVFHPSDLLERKAPGTNKNVIMLNSVMSKVARLTHSTYLDVESAFKDEDFLYDRMHLNGRGHIMIAKMISQALADVT